MLFPQLIRLEVRRAKNFAAKFAKVIGRPLRNLPRAGGDFSPTPAAKNRSPRAPRLLVGKGRESQGGLRDGWNDVARRADR